MFHLRAAEEKVSIFPPVGLTISEDLDANGYSGADHTAHSMHFGGSLMEGHIVRVLSLPALWLYRVALPWWLRTLAAQDQRAADRLMDLGDHDAAVQRLYLSRYRLDWVDEIVQSSTKR